MVKITEHGTQHPTFRTAGIRESGSQQDRTWHVPEETPVAFVYNKRNYAVMMATPDDLVDFAIGFSLSEQVVDTAHQIKAIDIQHSERGVDFRIDIDQQRLERLDIIQRRRNLVGSASCGLCGLENAETLFEPLPRVSDKFLTLTTEAVSLALESLRNHQRLNAKTHTVHGAAWADLSGSIAYTREDVGRHNALDKLIGCMALKEVDLTSGFVVMSSRCSYELVEKASRFGIPAMVTISAPTSFALAKAREAKISLYARSPMGVVEFLVDDAEVLRQSS
ncbi:MAG: formate dehydrogenase accessory sulfurtransferase FdhD [Acidimicrobiales bacterium]|nr:formate dehydrogenase accessory sulfurtransferase FdhD [Hyphomonadaceae bacterium]RZV42756.1 MAG: formate dehydrogenase accessory sulfurtransferase FdhD [Acidimicrobiales bacterium]